jgi:hypothetical protein
MTNRAEMAGLDTVAVSNYLELMTRFRDSRLSSSFEGGWPPWGFPEGILWRCVRTPHEASRLLSEGEPI